MINNTILENISDYKIIYYIQNGRGSNVSKWFRERDEVKTFILRRTDFLSNLLNYEPNIKQRLWHIKNNINYIPKCKTCGLDVKFTTKGYSSICSTKCAKGLGSISVTDPWIIKEWDFEKNTINPCDISRGSRTKFWWKCEKNHSFFSTPNERTNRRNNKISKCPFCIGRKVDSTNCFPSLYPDLFKEWDNDKNLIDPYKISGSKNKAWWKCTNNHSWEASIQQRISTTSKCPHCKIVYKGEEKIASFLNSHNIAYIKNKSFNECKNLYILKFDFYLPEFNICIEYDGEQHHEYVQHFHRTVDGFKNYQKRDKIKTEYCKLHNIPLIRIHFKDKDNINEILSDKLKLFF